MGPELPCRNPSSLLGDPQRQGGPVVLQVTRTQLTLLKRGFFPVPGPSQNLNQSTWNSTVFKPLSKPELPQVQKELGFLVVQAGKFTQYRESWLERSGGCSHPLQRSCTNPVTEELGDASHRVTRVRLQPERCALTAEGSDPSCWQHCCLPRWPARPGPLCVARSAVSGSALDFGRRSRPAGRRAVWVVPCPLWRIFFRI